VELVGKIWLLENEHSNRFKEWFGKYIFFENERNMSVETGFKKFFLKIKNVTQRGV
jgi:hypothetical protein